MACPPSPSDHWSDLHSSPHGLTRREAQERLRRFGSNRLEKIRGPSRTIKFLANFTHLMAVLLWVGGAIAFTANLPELGIAIWMVNLLNGLFSFWQEYKAEKAVAALRRLLPTQARVLRDDQEMLINSEDLVPGDVLLLASGDCISADAWLFEEQLLQVDQSSLTGESRPVRKRVRCHHPTVEKYPLETPDLVFAGTSVIAGFGRALVLATGMATQIGQIAGMTQGMGHQLSPLQKEIHHVTKVVTAVALVFGLVFCGLAILLIGMDVPLSLIFTLGMIAAFVPEGLLPTVTLALSLGVQRMAKRRALVKQLSSVETLGRTSIICTDKTGTLTRNEMTVRRLWTADRSFDVAGRGYEPFGEIRSGDASLPLPVEGDLRDLLLVAGLCNDARLISPSGDSPVWRIKGDPTEGALRVVAAKAGLDLEAAEKENPRIREIPFEASRRRMCTLHRSHGELLVLMKGATLEVLEHCRAIQVNGRMLPLTQERLSVIHAAMDDLAAQGLRVLACAWDHKRADWEHDQNNLKGVEEDLVFLGLAGMQDPPRAEVPEAISRCHRAGIRLLMISGDYGPTAAAVARDIGLIRTPEARILTGADLEAMTDDELFHALQGEVILARVAPAHKLRTVELLQRMGLVVAMTGDGVNDGPALKKADIGVAMGLSGTEVAREAADMILLDDNFASIVNAVEEGRAVYDNIKKFTSYIFTSNTPEAVPFIAFAFSGGAIPPALNIMQILSVDLGTDIVPALALGAEPPEPGVMEQAPRSLNDHIITWPLLVRAYLWLGSVQALAAMAAFYFQFWTQGHAGQWTGLPATGPIYEAATTMALAAIVMTQIGNLFTHRSASRPLKRIGYPTNHLIWIGILTELLLLAALIYLPIMQNIFGTAPLPCQNWLFLAALVPLLPVVDNVRKRIEGRAARAVTP